MITPKNVVHHELIGLYVKVVSNNDSLKLNGIVIDETKNTLKIEVEKENGIFEEKLIQKKIQYSNLNYLTENLLKLMEIFCQFVLKIE